MRNAAAAPTPIAMPTRGAAPNGPVGLRAMVSTRKLVDFETEFPARSNAVTVTVWTPSDSPSRVVCVVSPVNVCGGLPSTLTSTWSTADVASEAVHVTATL